MPDTIEASFDEISHCTLGSGDYATMPPFTESSIPIGLIIGVIVAILLLGFILVDLACFKINRQGITYMVCQRTRRRKKCVNQRRK